MEGKASASSRSDHPALRAASPRRIPELADALGCLPNDLHRHRQRRVRRHVPPADLQHQVVVEAGSTTGDGVGGLAVLAAVHVADGKGDGLSLGGIEGRMLGDGLWHGSVGVERDRRCRHRRPTAAPAAREAVNSVWPTQQTTQARARSWAPAGSLGLSHSRRSAARCGTAGRRGAGSRPLSGRAPRCRRCRRRSCRT